MAKCLKRRLKKTKFLNLLHDNTRQNKNPWYFDALSKSVLNFGSGGLIICLF